MDIHPYLALMRRYCIDYTSVHDVSVIDEIMRPGYRISVSGRTMDLAEYRQAVAGAFGRFPTLDLTVHDAVVSGDRFAMRFSEHGVSARHGGRAAVWRGISMYRWDGTALLACEVEQDFVARDRQLEGGWVDPLEVEAVDPWARTREAAPDPAAEAVVREWVDAWVARADRRHLEGADFRLVVDDSDLVGADDLVLDDARAELPDVISAGRTVVSRLVLHGAYAGGLHGVDPAGRGRPCELPAMLWADVDGDGRLAVVRIIRDRWGLQRRLR